MLPRMGAIMKRSLLKLSSLLLGIYAIAALAAGPSARAQSSPKYKYDSSWPKPFPSNWALGGITGMMRVMGRERVRKRFERWLNQA